MTTALLRCTTLFVLIAACSGESTPSIDSASSSAVANWIVRPDSFGPFQLGSPLAQAQSVLGDSLLNVANEATLNVTCDVMSWPFMPGGTSLLVLTDSGQPSVERVDVVKPGVLTAEGAGVGDTEARVLELYRGRVTVQPHKYMGPTGHYLVVTVSGDTLHRIIFETDGQRVTRYRGGRRPGVELVESCG
jgi:hypothetical protein